ncbi:MAG TPA: group III truncated hemoglobin [Flavobacteriaceae bacterium]|nr:group III truncated hemoglobin [Flavobacteriaceae bacterium]
MKKDIQSREDIFLLVDTFYKKVRKDALIGPIFNSQIDNWPEHLEKLTDFWETNLLFERKYKGNPLLAHQLVDEKSNFSVEQIHFGTWLNLWYATIDNLFEGENASTAKRRARKMSTFMFLKIFENRSLKKQT